MFNFSFDVFEISFIYAAFLSFRRFFLFNFKFKKHMFSSEIRLTLDNSVWETFSMQSNLQAFPRLFFPYYPVRWFIMWYETYPRACLKKAFCKMCVTICGIFCPDEGAVVGYDNWIRVKYPAKWGVQIAGMIFQTLSSVVLWHKKILKARFSVCGG